MFPLKVGQRFAGGSSGFGYSTLSARSIFKEWKTSCPEASLAERIASTCFLARGLHRSTGGGSGQRLPG
jgi:hypothetical protein